MNIKQRLLAWTKTSDQWFIFHPSRWPHRELVSRATALAIIVTFLVLRIYKFHRFPGTYASEQAFFGGFKTAGGGDLYSTAQIAGLWGIKLAAWSIETLIYLGYVASYASRAKAVDIAKGFMETAFPIIVAGIPLLISFLPYRLPRWVPYGSGHHATFYLAIMALIVAGGLLNLIGLVTLRRAFTIMTEARTLITRGIFGVMRHPLYTGHFIMFFGSMLLHLDWTAAGMYLIFLAGQVMRAKMEERKLSQVFPEYERYSRSTGMFFPKLRVLGACKK
ncbi:MAG: isoprenylcysteine carboxylmethyltransferase family protein [Desulfobacteraceae bacterium]|jgi:protein-S-isoprenylcysteine O-methyltransferase Ste14